MLEQLSAILVTLAIIAGSTTELIEKLKPVFLDKFQERVSEQVYLITIYVIRLAAVAFGVATFNVVGSLVGAFPSMIATPPVILWAALSLVTSLGSDVIYTIVDYLGLLRGTTGTAGVEVDLDQLLEYLKNNTPADNPTTNTGGDALG